MVRTIKHGCERTCMFIYVYLTP